MKRVAFVFGWVVLTGCLVFAQRRGRGGWFRETHVPDSARTAREVESHSTGTPVWTNATGFETDVFTFARVKYTRGGHASRGDWTTDCPDSDLNLSYRVQQMTSVRVDPDGRLLSLTERDLTDYPFLYIVEPGGLWLDEHEVLALRRYLLNGGFLMLDDFWGEAAWENVARVMREVFPDREFVELPLTHEIYQRPFKIEAKGQVPNVWRGIQSEEDGITWEQPDAQEVHHRALFDDDGRLMVLATHNTDNGDGWEREGENDYYFHQFSEKVSYPLGINIIFHIMTH
ncbi:MAG: DUF4159 domain-containing protein [Verrucomicrobiales bacterium]|nr:DUF4159 domain-containing protein [Verrucomicrobiales bacterium]